MKKSLIALAALAASGMAMAQSSVTLFGVVDTGIAYESGSAAGKNESWTGVQNNGNVVSRLGFRGTEDLGNGLKANFWLEGAIAPDTGATALDFQRRSTVGLQGGFGEVRLGRELTAAYNATARYDVMGQAGYGSSLLWGEDRENRVSNAVTYISNNYNGFAFGVNYGFGEKAGENRNSRYIGTGLTYDNGPLSLGFGLERANNAGGKLTGATKDSTAWSLGGSYNFGVAKLAAAYRDARLKPAVGGGKSDKLRGFLVGASAPVGQAGEVRATYNHYRYKVAGTNTTEKANELALGYVHNLSKRTALYGTYAYIKNKNDGTRFVLNSANTRVRDNGAQHGLQAGIRHAF